VTTDDDAAIGRLHEPKDASADGRFPAAALADEPQRAAARDGKTHAIDGPHGADLTAEEATANREVRPEIVDAHEWFGRQCHAGAASTSAG
jgi:hypothetical protein